MRKHLMSANMLFTTAPAVVAALGFMATSVMAGSSADSLIQHHRHLPSFGYSAYQTQHAPFVTSLQKTWPQAGCGGGLGATGTTGTAPGNGPGSVSGQSRTCKANSNGG
jgi:hypothetical protein